VVRGCRESWEVAAKKSSKREINSEFQPSLRNTQSEEAAKRRSLRVLRWTIGSYLKKAN
jgi:hypothetical protein